MKIEYPFIKYFPIVTVMSGSHISGYAMMSFERHRKQVTHFVFACLSVLSNNERAISGYKYRVAPDTAITGNGVKDTPVQSQSERDKTVAGNESSPVRTAGGRNSRGAVSKPPFDDFLS